MVSILQSLSQELIDEIIDVGVAMEDNICDDIWRSKWNFLSSCALVCRSFLPRSQQHLFSQIHLGDNLDRNKRVRGLRRLSRILQESPHIAGYVRELHLKLPCDDNTWVTEEFLFLSIMERIKESKGSLQKLTLLNHAYPKPLHDPAAFVTHFSNRFISPFITFLDIHSLQVPTAIFWACVNLTHLKLHLADFELTPSPSLGIVLRPQIKILQYGLSHPAISKLLGIHTVPISLSSLRVLKLGKARPPDLACLQTIIDTSGGSLEVLDLFEEGPIFDGLSKYHIPIDGCINLSKSTSVQFLCFGAFLGRPGTDHLSGVWNTLQTVPTENRVRKISLTICIDFLNTTRTGPSGCVNANWEELDHEINRISMGSL
ncbi:hypothetical protein M413DRAFT_32313 [Hebeloma cylindrosporum]|uniref:F-box domain-containing protein n=1 Tax=Hebeloma cylindrosporum TaxID=76867 RepID=A0A0C3BUC2_HEBCY|nr:hypothetical protein M413DRAFT_32313 [Hebeloma cylindrosporum h7]